MVKQNYLKLIRKLLKLNQAEIIDESITRNTISHIENHKVSLTEKTITLILDTINRHLISNGHIIRIEYDDLFTNRRFEQKFNTEKLYFDLQYKISSKSSDLNEIIKKIDIIFSKWDFSRLKVSTYSLLGNHHYSKYDYTLSNFYFNQTVQPIYKYGTINEIANVIIDVMKSEIMLNINSTAIDLTAQLLSRESELDKTILSKLRFNSALIYQNMKLYEKALVEVSFLEQLIDADDIYRYTELMILKAICYEALNKFTVADKIYNDLLKSLLQSADSELKSSIYSNLLSLYVKTNNKIGISEALYSLFLLLPDIPKDSIFLSDIYIEMALSYRHLMESEHAYKYFDLAIKSASVSNEYRNLSDALWHYIDMHELLEITEYRPLSNLLIQLLISEKISLDNIAIYKYLELLNTECIYNESSYILKKINNLKLDKKRT